MKLWNVEQGSDEWHRLRLGIPTASQFHRVITPAKLEPSKQIKGYAYELAYERLFREMKSGSSSMFMERGKIVEEMARDEFSKMFGAVALGGFATTDDGRIGCSPDGILTTEPTGLEIKCPSGPVHLDYLLNGPGTDYALQVQGCMLVTGLKEWYFCSYHQKRQGQNAEQPWQMKVIKFKRDEKVIDALKTGLYALLKEVDLICEQMLELGFTPIG